VPHHGPDCGSQWKSAPRDFPLKRFSRSRDCPLNGFTRRLNESLIIGDNVTIINALRLRLRRGSLRRLAPIQEVLLRFRVKEHKHAVAIVHEHVLQKESHVACDAVLITHKSCLLHVSQHIDPAEEVEEAAVANPDGLRATGFLLVATGIARSARLLNAASRVSPFASRTFPLYGRAHGGGDIAGRPLIKGYADAFDQLDRGIALGWLARDGSGYSYGEQYGYLCNPDHG
jgi:hypothetical protein